MERLRKAGVISPKSASQVKESRLGIGFEKLDRDIFDPEKVYDKVADIGVKWIRLQSGWERTEKQKGVYDFEWLDKITDNLISRGMTPWMCLCYGNGLYDEMAAKTFGGAGYPPIYSDEAKNAWSAYVTAVTKHFKGRIVYYEVWNEPDGIWCWKKGVNPKEYGEFVVLTAKAIKAGDENAKVVGGSLCMDQLDYIHTAFETGMANCIDVLSFHMYTIFESYITKRYNALRGLCDLYNPSIEIIQGESGSPSRHNGYGALHQGKWTQRKQAKQLVRHAVTDLMTDVKFSSYFTAVDMPEALHGVNGDAESINDYGFFGVLGEVFDEKGQPTGVYEPKLSYKALQTLASVFSDEYEKAYLPVLPFKASSPAVLSDDINQKDLICCGFKKPNGSGAFVYWTESDLLATDIEATVSMHISGLKGRINLVDLMTGQVYDIPDTIMKKISENSYTFENLPVTDYPLMLTFGDFADVTY